MSLYGQTLGRSRSVSQYARENLYYCDRAGYFGGNPNFQVDRDCLHDYLLIYVHSGIFHLESGDWNSPVSSGQTAIVNLQEKHRYYSDRHDPCEILWMDFYAAPGLMKPLTSLAALPLIFRDPANMTLMNDFVYQYVHNSHFTEAAQSTAIYRLLISAIAYLTIGQPAGRKHLVAVEDYINKNIQSRITLIELANVLHISPDHFAHLFKQQYGVAPMHYVREQKINQARFLLTYSNATITQIAEQLGFYSQSHFSALFKRYAGCYPTEFRGRGE